MPKGRGSNLRRRSYRQLHPKDNEETIFRGHIKLVELGVRATLVQKASRKGRKAVYQPSKKRSRR